MISPSELNCRFSLHGRGGVERTVAVAATSVECERIALRLMIPAVGKLACNYRLMPMRDQSVLCDGWLGAEVTLECCVTGESFNDVISEAFSVRFVVAEKASQQDTIDPSIPDEIPFDGQVVDLGALTVEQLALSLPAFPRMPGLSEDAADAAQLDVGAPEPEDGAPKTRPFAKLAHLMAGKVKKRS